MLRKSVYRAPAAPAVAANGVPAPARATVRINASILRFVGVISRFAGISFRVAGVIGRVAGISFRVAGVIGRVAGISFRVAGVIGAFIA